MVETTGSGERGMNPVAVTIIILGKNIGRAGGSNQLPPVLQVLAATDRAKVAHLRQTDRNTDSPFSPNPVKAVIRLPFLRILVLLLRILLYLKPFKCNKTSE